MCWRRRQLPAATKAVDAAKLQVEEAEEERDDLLCITKGDFEDHFAKL
jgi:hypothetical protein